jgi:Transposase
MKTADLCRKHGISEGCFYNWKAKYGGLEVSEPPRTHNLVRGGWSNWRVCLRYHTRQLSSSVAFRAGSFFQDDTGTKCA